MPSRRKEGWEVGTVGAGAGVGPPRKREQWQSGDSEKVWLLNHVTRHTLITSTLRQRTSRQETLPLNERSPSRSRSSPPAEAGFVGTEVWITGTTSFPPRRSNKSFACQNENKENKCFKYLLHHNTQQSDINMKNGTLCLQNQSFPHLVARLGHRWWVFRFDRVFRFPICLNNLCGTIGRTFLHDGHSLQKSWSTLSGDEMKKRNLTQLLYRHYLFQKEISPHVVIFLEECVVLHSSLLKLHINAAAVYWNHLFDSAKTSFKYYRLVKGEVKSAEVPSTLKKHLKKKTSLTSRCWNVLTASL